MDFRFGHGFDVHRFIDGEFIILCGLKIAFSKSLLGHSDSDVGLHSITDALYGAIGCGDIGQHFPPTEKKWRNADSRIFLEHAQKTVHNQGYDISNIDITFICEVPKISQYKAPMEKKLSEILEIELSRINIKATTSEGLGFTGRKEGIACLTTLGLISKC
ncbi:MAG: 2-C-methyl-D-erythritol 2,4-cyclodiphosphate synthase [Paracoccaceae bacterium]